MVTACGSMFAWSRPGPVMLMFVAFVIWELRDAKRAFVRDSISVAWVFFRVSVYGC